MVSLSLGYPDFESELAMAKSISAEDRLEKVEDCAGRPDSPENAGGDP